MVAFRPRIVFLDAGSVDLGDVDTRPFKRLGTYRAFGNSTPRQALKRAAGAEVVIVNKCNFKEADFRALPKLKLLCVAATGVNNIDLNAARERGVAVTNVPGYSTGSVAEHALLFLLALSHRLIEHDRAAKGGLWPRSQHFAVLDYPFAELKGKTLGIIGYGQIGRAVARLAKAFGMTVLIARIPGRRYSGSLHRPLDSVLGQSDFVSVHCPLTRLTRHLLDRRRIGRMKKGARLLNLARGPVVDETAVFSALRAGRLGGFASDVLDREPPPADHPFFRKELAGKVLLTPHVAWASREARQRLIDEIALNISDYKKGKRRNRIV